MPSSPRTLESVDMIEADSLATHAINALSGGFPVADRLVTGLF